MTDDQIERAVERKVDKVDALYMAGGMTQEAYAAAMIEIDDWATREYVTAAAEARARAKGP
jgi:hypothetical protein